MYLNHSIDNRFPENLNMTLTISHSIQNNIIYFNINFYVIEKINDEKIDYNVEFVGSYDINLNKLKVSQKGKGIFCNEFIFNGKILIKNLFQDFLLPVLSNTN